VIAEQMKRKIENMPFDVEEYINIEYPTIDPDWGK
jgi:hypothetical protein